MHDLRIDEFNAKTSVIQGGQTQTIEFIADKTGSFEYYCSVGTHRQMGMRGTLTVK
jgi:plastocyanin